MKTFCFELVKCFRDAHKRFARRGCNTRNAGYLRLFAELLIFRSLSADKVLRSVDTLTGGVTLVPGGVVANPIFFCIANLLWPILVTLVRGPAIARIQQGRGTQ